MKLTFLIAALLVTLFSKAQCPAFRPAINIMLGAPAHVSFQAGIIGQTSPFSGYLGIRTKFIGATKTTPGGVKWVPSVELNYRFVRHPFYGVHLYAGNTGAGVALNVGDDLSGIRIRAGYKEFAFGIFKMF